MGIKSRCLTSEELLLSYHFSAREQSVAHLSFVAPVVSRSEDVNFQYVAPMRRGGECPMHRINQTKNWLNACAMTFDQMSLRTWVLPLLHRKVSRKTWCLVVFAFVTVRIIKKPHTLTCHWVGSSLKIARMFLGKKPL